MEKQKCLFIDLDWTLIRPHEAGIGNYIEASSNKPIKSNQIKGSFPKDSEHRFAFDDWKFIAGALENLLKYYLEGYKIIIVTNQLGVNYGYYRPHDIENKVNYIKDNILHYIAMYLNNINEDGIPVVRYERAAFFNDSISFEIYMSPRIKKPSSQIKKVFMEKYNYDPKTSLFVGDAAGRVHGGIKLNEPPSPSGYSTMATYAKDLNYDFNKMMENWNKEFPGKTVKKYTELDYEVCDFSDTDKKFAESLGVEFNNETEFLSGKSFISNKTTKKK